MVSPLEERLIGSGLITAEQLTRAHDEGRVSGKSFWTHLVRLGFLSEADLARFLARQLRVPFIMLDDYAVNPRVLALVDEALNASPTLAAAQAVLTQSRELYAAQAGATQRPQLDLGLGAQRQQISPSAQGLAGDTREFSLYGASVGVRYRF